LFVRDSAVAASGLRRVKLDPAAPIAGIDVGERFLDIAIVVRARRSLVCRRVKLDDLDTTRSAAAEGGIIAAIARRLVAEAPELANAVAIVDSPAWPADLDLANPGATRHGWRPQDGREIDRRLRLLVSELRAGGAFPALRPLALYPTPVADYFARQIASRGCKPHLRAIGSELFGTQVGRAPRRLIGGTFTRFMIVGFAAHRALGTAAAAVYEGYPDLQFRLWSNSPELPPKKGRRGSAGRPRVTAHGALAVRLRLLEALAASLGMIDACEQVTTHDMADAAVLALCAAAARERGAIEAIDAPAEGQFLLALPFAAGVRTAQGAC
jgi:hypothetical protein